MIWSYPTGANMLSIASISDVNGDGIFDCLASGFDDEVFCISGRTGELIWSYLTAETVFHVEKISDVNDDGVEDCIAGGGDNKVYCINGMSGEGFWTSSTVGSVVRVASVSDLNGNGVNDVIGGSDDSYIYVYEGGEVIIENIDISNTPSGLINGKAGTSLEFSTEKATSKLGHLLEYHFDWGDSVQVYSWTLFHQSPGLLCHAHFH